MRSTHSAVHGQEWQTEDCYIRRPRDGHSTFDHGRRGQKVELELGKSSSRCVVGVALVN